VFEHTSTGLESMTTRLRHALEVSDGSATLYLSGRLAGSDIFVLRGVCRDIPLAVRTLRLDLHGVTALEEGAMDTVRALVRYWRETHHGDFRLAFASEHVVASVVEHENTAATGTRIDQLIERTAALTGMFL
jgi:hypothetical protein